ncbi:MAG: sulfite exporter TauE/SafE family protein [Hyphomicrobiales bacterium]
MLVSAATSFITAAFGIGGGVVLIGILATLLPPAALIPVHGLVQFGSNVGRLVIMRAHVVWTVFPAFLAGNLLGAATGGLIAVNLPAPAVQVGIGAFILFSVYMKIPDIGRGAGWVAGAIASFLAMFFGATGPFVAAYVWTLKLGRMQHVATHAAFMTAQHLIRVLAFGLLGFVYGPYLPLIAAMIATGFMGTIIGRLVLMRINDGKFRWALNAILTVLALRLIWSGAASAFDEFN